jgi:aspartyl-tRNA(Asn)/glutamyl-tRNA(Gln) amidotransferase subunit B
MTAYLPTIGMEIHAELNTKTKMFCHSKNDPDETRPNVNVCPVCLAHPGVLPVINAAAVKHVLHVGLAIGARLADYTEFDRKNYFYPDLPKGYQLSQYEFPLVSGGSLAGVEITRIHLEEDTASSVHDDASGATLIDYNRAGVPLMELVTEPVIHSAAQAGVFARELQLLLRYLGASEANMEKGQMRVEANVSVAPEGMLGTKVEIKNLNSFRIMERAVAYEIERQTAVLESGGTVVQETRGWDENKQQTFSQRIKEGSADYRYFPDPDLPSLRLSEIRDYSIESLKKAVPELPWERRARYLALGVKPEDAELYTRTVEIGGFFDEVHAVLKDKEKMMLASNYIANDLMNLLRDTDTRDTDSKEIVPISAERFAKIIDMAFEKRISSRSAKDLLTLSLSEDANPEKLAEERGLFRVSGTDALGAIVDTVIAAHTTVAADYKAGKHTALQFLIGQGMKASQGAADPAILAELFKDKIGS